VRVLYPGLHGVARSKDVPIGEFGRWIEHGSAIGSAVMSTELRHTHLAGGEQG
jgi:glutamine synthetase